MNWPKEWYRSKTVWAGILAAAIALADRVLGMNMIPAHVAELVIAGQAVLHIVLRLLTGEPIKGSPAAKE